jgi:hypothetical protein
MDKHRVPRLCTYVVRKDTGLAPNPFWGWCSLAVCTPNPQGTRLTAGDWIAGCLEKGRGHRLVYAVEVAEVLDLDDYFNDPRFQIKKPNLRGNWKERCGDNFYSRDSNGSWIQHRNRFHLDEPLKRQDTKFARVFLGRRYWYRGSRVNHDPGLSQAFMDWIARTLDPGVADDPNDNPDLNEGDGSIAPSCGSQRSPRQGLA